MIEGNYYCYLSGADVRLASSDRAWEPREAPDPGDHSDLVAWWWVAGMIERDRGRSCTEYLWLGISEGSRPDQATAHQAVRAEYEMAGFVGTADLLSSQ